MVRSCQQNRKKCVRDRTFIFVKSLRHSSRGTQPGASIFQSRSDPHFRSPMTPRLSYVRAFAVTGIAACSLGAQELAAQCPAMTRAPLPVTYSGPPTTAPINACDLMTRLYRFANDSMGGRRVGTADHERATAYIAAEAKRLGLKPAGDDGTYFQALPLVSRALDVASTIVVDGATLKAGDDFLATTTAAHTSDFANIKIVYGGTLLDTTSKLFRGARDWKRRCLPPGGAGARSSRDPAYDEGTRLGDVVQQHSQSGHSATPAQITPAALRTATNPTTPVLLVDQGAALTLTLTSTALQSLFSAPLDGLAAGTASKPITFNLKFVDTPKISPQRDCDSPRQRCQTQRAVRRVEQRILITSGLRAHRSITTSVRALHMGSRAGTEGAASRKQTTEDEEYDRIRFLNDSLHKAKPGATRFGKQRRRRWWLRVRSHCSKSRSRSRRRAVKPKRALLFVWHTGAEGTPALSGSNWLMDHPTIARDSIVAAFDVDMIGRGEKTDEVGITADEIPRYGSPDFLEITGPRRLLIGICHAYRGSECGGEIRTQAGAIPPTPKDTQKDSSAGTMARRTRGTESRRRCSPRDITRTIDRYLTSHNTYSISTWLALRSLLVHPP